MHAAVTPPSRTPRAFTPGEGRRLSARPIGVRATEVEEYAEEIKSALAHGEIDDAYEHFQEWASREARYARHGHAANLGPLLEMMLDLIGWMYPRVPREMVRVAARAA